MHIGRICYTPLTLSTGPRNPFQQGILAYCSMRLTIKRVPVKSIKYYRLYSNMSMLLGCVWLACGIVGKMPRLLGAGVALMLLTLAYIVVAKASAKNS